MAGEERRSLRDFVTSKVQGIASSITQPVVDANNFELKPALISMVQQSHFGRRLWKTRITPLGLLRGVYTKVERSFQ